VVALGQVEFEGEAMVLLAIAAVGFLAIRLVRKRTHLLDVSGR
jgi:hypothetical protein